MEILKGYKIGCCGKFSCTWEKMYEKIKSLGGTVSKNFQTSTTHLITTKENYQKKTRFVGSAIKAGIFIVSEQFIIDCQEKKIKLDESFYLINKEIKEDDEEDEEEEEEEGEEKEVEEKEIEINKILGKRKSPDTKNDDFDDEEEEEEISSNVDSLKLMIPNKTYKDKKGNTRFSKIEDGDGFLKISLIESRLKSSKVIFYPCAQQCLDGIVQKVFESYHVQFIKLNRELQPNDITIINQTVLHPTLLKKLEQDIQHQSPTSPSLIQYLQIDHLTKTISNQQQYTLTKESSDQLYTILNTFIIDLLERIITFTSKNNKQKWISGSNIRRIVCESITLSFVVPSYAVYRPPKSKSIIKSFTSDEKLM